MSIVVTCYYAQPWTTGRPKQRLKHKSSLITPREHTCDISKLDTISTGGGGANKVANKKNDEKRPMFMKPYHNTVPGPQNNDWYYKAYNRFSVSKTRTDQLIDDIEKLLPKPKRILH